MSARWTMDVPAIRELFPICGPVLFIYFWQFPHVVSTTRPGLDTRIHTGQIKQKVSTLDPLRHCVCFPPPHLASPPILPPDPCLAKQTDRRSQGHAPAAKQLHPPAIMNTPYFRGSNEENAMATSPLAPQTPSMRPRTDACSAMCPRTPECTARRPLEACSVRRS